MSPYLDQQKRMEQWRISYPGFYWQLFHHWAELKHSDRWPQEAFKINLLQKATHMNTHTGPQLQHILCQCISMWRECRNDGCLTHRLRSDQISSAAPQLIHTVLKVWDKKPSWELESFKQQHELLTSDENLEKTMLTPLSQSKPSPYGS